MVIPLTVNKIASSGGFGPLYTSFPLYGSPLNGSFTVLPDDVRSKGVVGLVQFGSVLFACKPTNHEGC